MKSLLVMIATLIATTTAQAKIAASNLDERHQQVIEQAIEKNCFNFRHLEQASVTEEIIQVDQGIQDRKYTSQFKATVRLDQQIFDTYNVTIVSMYWDGYDHSTRNWGSYSVESVSCVQE